ncbi:hypothetical protein JX265_006288 [Neoarthrinium moseri]|uniref:2EXR domain-containing protein n=1 Tax=Neoarthrinium moseri TaxID=1658444 RepID=A0A9P9WLT7_9PEZI|nr:uncharacterized protein JN550_008321 [Neoarthrinium moseri]KAI1852239.1 hypothetical protein JX266_002417 [Neoarthrinium moseri]KAI1865564.1 hypothetical protein JN550_008321 [Neoarthrinium moseri]KAI1870118.1 hypothetical protein JX265_006288 [Neoarthrinium moseri]
MGKTSTTGSPFTNGTGQRPETKNCPTAAGFPKFADLPQEIRDMIWRKALPEPRTINVLVYAFPGLKLAPLDRGTLRLTLAGVCFESRRVVRESGYVLAFRDEDDPNDPGVWFNPRRDTLERTLWGPGENWGLR